MKTLPNAYLPLLAEGMVNLIKSWRAEAEITKPKTRPSLPSRHRLETFLRKAETRGLPALLVAITVLSCEWVFRVRRASESDITTLLDEMEAGLYKPGGITPFQAGLLIKSLEREIRRQIDGLPILIVNGFDPGKPYSPWPWLFDSEGRALANWRTLAGGPLRNRNGIFPVLAPKIAGVITDALAEEKQKKGQSNSGRELSAVLLNRDEVQSQEFGKWRRIIAGFSRHGKSFREDFRDIMKKAHYQTFEMPNVTISPDVFLERCKIGPETLFFWLKQDDILSAVYSAKWGDPKTSRDTIKK